VRVTDVKQIIFVLHQIVDRMDNMLQLRTAYGSGPLEEFNVQPSSSPNWHQTDGNRLRYTLIAETLLDLSL